MHLEISSAKWGHFVQWGGGGGGGDKLNEMKNITCCRPPQWYLTVMCNNIRMSLVVVLGVDFHMIIHIIIRL